MSTPSPEPHSTSSSASSSATSSTPASGLFVTGTDTAVGKTVVCSWLAHHWQADYWKPVQSGLDGITDTEYVRQLSGAHCHPERWRLTHPLSPHRAAELDGVRINLDDFVLPKARPESLPNAQRLIVEGAGGLLVPINDQTLMIDLAAHLGLPVLLVARGTLGTINHTLLSIAALRTRGLPLLGVVISGVAAGADAAAIAEINANAQAIMHHGKVPVLARLPRFSTLAPEALAQCPMPDALRNALDQLNGMDHA